MKALTDESDFEINRNRLDWECQRQPVLYSKYSYALAEAKLELDQANAELELIKAELSTTIRSDPADYGLEKVTESALSTVLVLEEEYQEALTKTIEAKHVKEVLFGAVMSLDNKKKSLQGLIELHNSGYFSEPNPKSKRKKK